MGKHPGRHLAPRRESGTVRFLPVLDGVKEERAILKDRSG